MALKELRESYNTLQILSRYGLIADGPLLQNTIKECIKLISILVKSISTALKNKATE